MTQPINRNNIAFSTIEEIVSHIRGTYSHMVWIGKDYSITALCADLEKIDKEIHVRDIEGDHP
jgi:hypothetical protein